MTKAQKSGVKFDKGENLELSIQREYLENMDMFMASEDESGICLMKQTDLAPTHETIRSEVANDPRLLPESERERTVFIFKPAFCVGIPDFVQLWSHMNILANQFQRYVE
jgi:hypothetical protein